MKNGVNQRILLLKSELDCTSVEFCAKAKISNGTLANIQNGEPIGQKTIRTIADALKVNKEWLLTGNGDRKLTVVRDDQDDEINSFQKALKLLEEQLRKKDEQIADLISIIGGPNFLEPLNDAMSGYGPLRVVGHK